RAPSIRVHHAGHAARYILHLIHVLLWLAAFLSRMPLERRGTQDWLRPGDPTCLRPNPTPHHTWKFTIGSDKILTTPCHNYRPSHRHSARVM
uniref:Glycoprotein n=1 Tax=Mesocestoides corti TaxID=53468 RepID=A0A5K3EPZ0_MESCO